MDYTEEQRIRAELKSNKETAEKALNLVEAVVRRHPEQDAKTALLTSRIERIEKILKIEIEAAEKQHITTGETPKKGLIDRMLGR